MKRLCTAAALWAMVGSTVAFAQQAAPTTPEGDCPEGTVPCPEEPGTGGAGAPTATIVSGEEQGHGVNQVNPFGVMTFGGVEGYAGVLAPHLNAGFTGGVAAFYEPWQFLGFELGYSGGVAYLKSNTGGGPDLVRNGGYLIATPGMTFGLAPIAPTVSIKPYLLGGIGIDGFNSQNGGPAAGWSSTVDGNIPFGGGVEVRVDHIVANARWNWDWGFGSQFNPYTTEPLHYKALLTVGAAF